MKAMAIPKSDFITICDKSLEKIREIRVKDNTRLIHSNRRTCKKWILFGERKVESSDEVIQRLASTLPNPLYPSQVLEHAVRLIRSMKHLATASCDSTVIIEQDDTKLLLFNGDRYLIESEIDAYLQKHNL